MEDSRQTKTQKCRSRQTDSDRERQKPESVYAGDGTRMLNV
jgi:hypothetical protein